MTETWTYVRPEEFSGFFFAKYTDMISNKKKTKIMPSVDGTA